MERISLVNPALSAKKGPKRDDSVTSIDLNFNSNQDPRIQKCYDETLRRLDMLQMKLDTLKVKREKVDSEVKLTKRMIREAAEDMHETIEKDQQKLLRETEYLYENTNIELNVIEESLRKNAEATTEFLEFVGDLRTSPDLSEMDDHLEMMRNTKKKLREIRMNVNVGSLSFKPSPPVGTSLLGKVEINDVDTSDPYSTIPKKVASINGNFMVAGLTVLAGKLYVARELQSQLEVFHIEDLSKGKVLKLEGLKKPVDIASDSISSLVYILESSGALFKLQPDPVVLNKIFLQVSGDPHGLAVVGGGASNSGNLLVTCTDSRLCKEFTSSGSVVRTIKFQQDVFNPWQCLPLMREKGTSEEKQFVVENFAICHGFESGKMHRVCLVDESGHITKSFGNSNGAGSSKLDFPNRMLVDAFGYFLVADRNNNRVVLLSPNLVYVRDLIKGETSMKPRRFHLEIESGLLFVGLVNGSVLIYQLLDHKIKNRD